MNRTKSTTKNHGPCDICGTDIDVGQQMVTLPRDATIEELRDKNVKKFTIPGGPPFKKVQIKCHKECKELYTWRNGKWRPNPRWAAANDVPYSTIVQARRTTGGKH